MASRRYDLARPVQVTRLDDSRFPTRAASLTASVDSSGSPNASEYSPTSSRSPTSTVSSQTSRDTNSSYEKSSWFGGDSKRASLRFMAPRLNRNSVATYDSCQFDTDDWFAQFRDDIDISDEIPSSEAMEAAANTPVFDAAGNSRPFKSLYTMGDAIGDRQLVIFVRHFFCGACQAYIKALVSEINMQTYFTMAIPTSITVIGCGSPELIRHYKAVTSCPFPIYADPTRQVFKNLGMNISFNALGKKRPEYMKDISPAKWVHEQTAGQMKVKGLKKFRGGNVLQIGGEFLFQDGELTWCHRMKNYRNHAEVDVIKRILEID